MAEFEHLEEMVIGLYDRQILGCANSHEEYIPLKSGRESPHYANFRGIMSVDQDLASEMSFDQQIRVRDLVVDASVHALNGLALIKNFDHLVPIPQAVTQLGGAIALRAGRSSLNVRVPEGEKGYGKHKPVEGNYREGDRVVGFDDVVTTGDAKAEFLEPVEKLAGLTVTDYLVVLDRQEGGRTNVEASGRGLTAVIGMYEVAEMLHSNKKLSAQQYSFILDYLAEYGDL